MNTCIAIFKITLQMEIFKIKITEVYKKKFIHVKSLKNNISIY